MTRLVMAWAAAVAMAVLPGAAAAGDDDGDALLDALQRWSRRSVEELRLPDAPAPQRSVFATLDHEYYAVVAVFGSVVSEGGHRSRPTRVEVVVGDDERNSSRFRSSDRLPRVVSRPSLVVEDVPVALERDLWITSDAAYKNAVKQLQVKQAAMAALGGDPPPPDWSAAPAVDRVEAVEVAPVDGATLRDVAVRASARLAGVEGLRHGEVQARAVRGRYLLVTSEGTRLVQPEEYVVVYAWADTLRPDGVQVYDRRQWVVATVGDLPPADAIADEVEEMGRAIARRVEAQVVDYYEGPVVFDGVAAAEFLRYMVPGELCGTPPVPQAGRSYQQQVRSGPRLGRRLLPAGWTVVDDPGRTLPGLAGSYTHDREGVPGRAVELVHDGTVVDLLMTRVPRLDLAGSNGHARGSIQGTWEARPSVWEVRPDRALSTRAFERQVARSLKASGLERILVVRRMQAGKAGELPRPTEAVWRYADGREEPVLSLSFASADRRTLRDIVAAGGGQQIHAYLDSWTLASAADGNTGIPAVLLAPRSLLVEEMEAVFPGPNARPHALVPPPLAGGGAP